MPLVATIRRHRRSLILLGLIALLVTAAALDPVHEAVQAVLEAARPIIRHHEVLGVLLFGLLSALSAVLFFFSSALLVPVAMHAWGKPWTLLILWTSWLVGAAASYWLGRKPGRKLARWLGSERHIQQYEHAITAEATFTKVLLFQLAVPSEIPGYVLGALKYPFRRYLAARALAEVPFAIGAVYLGDSFLRRQYGLLVAIALAGVALSGLALAWLHRKVEGARS